MRSMWQDCPRGDYQPQWAAPFSVSLNPMGVMRMSKRTWENLGEPKALRLMFDNVNSRIGLKPAALNSKNAYPVLNYGRSGGKMVRANRLIKEFRIVLPHTVKFTDPDTDDDGILILDLRTAKPSEQSLNHWTRKAKGGHTDESDR